MRRLCGAAGLAGGLVASLTAIGRAAAEGRPHPGHGAKPDDIVCDFEAASPAPDNIGDDGKGGGQHVVIIGGGIVGSSLAFHLAARMQAGGSGRDNVPHRITILEKDVVGEPPFSAAAPVAGRVLAQ